MSLPSFGLDGLCSVIWIVGYQQDTTLVEMHNLHFPFSRY